MNRKLIFLDIDGTLTTPGSNVPPDRAREAGAVLALVSESRDHRPRSPSELRRPVRGGGAVQGRIEEAPRR